jgi:cytoskeletal protein CcmA (bactofilin family)
MASRIANGLSIEGELKCDGDIEVDGRVEGRIGAKRVTVLEGGHVKGTILADTVHVNGTVEGEIGAIAVILGEKAVVSAEITYRSIEVTQGACLVGGLHGTDAGDPSG